MKPSLVSTLLCCPVAVLYYNQMEIIKVLYQALSIVSMVRTVSPFFSVLPSASSLTQLGYFAYAPQPESSICIAALVLLQVCISRFPCMVLHVAQLLIGVVCNAVCTCYSVHNHT